jgi:hypothetical protein
MKRRPHGLIVASLVLALSTLNAFAQADVLSVNNPNGTYGFKLTFKVIDEAQAPIAGAKAAVEISDESRPRGVLRVEGTTNDQGLISIESRGDNSVKLWVTGPGFYPSEKRYSWKIEDAEAHGRATKSGLQPWNPTVPVTLKKIGDRVPMFVFPGECPSSEVGVPPAVATDLLYDLMVGDWVAPFGVGKVGDLEMRFLGAYEAEGKHWGKYWMRFPNKGDGLIPVPSANGEADSTFRFPRLAPEDGYESAVFHKEYSVNDSGQLPDYRQMAADEKDQQALLGYLLRFRCQRDEQGKITSCYYGKLTSPVKFIPTGRFSNKPLISFSYYLNPNPNDRRIEFDQETNLNKECTIPASNLTP